MPLLDPADQKWVPASFEYGVNCQRADCPVLHASYMTEVVYKCGRKKAKIEVLLIILTEGRTFLTRAEDGYWWVFSIVSRASRW